MQSFTEKAEQEVPNENPTVDTVTLDAPVPRVPLVTLNIYTPNDTDEGPHRREFIHLNRAQAEQMRDMLSLMLDEWDALTTPRY